ncbi:hypothetical protein [Virgibacillus sp. DJP39]|uniref:hypothetical protein n=1 Tax=Virgibacillus sp. DJP39 TaxID=3409790 RepID=UPI003BB68D0D
MNENFLRKVESDVKQRYMLKEVKKYDVRNELENDVFRLVKETKDNFYFVFNDHDGYKGILSVWFNEENVAGLRKVIGVTVDRK